MYAGGFRERLIGQSVHQLIKGCLTQLGWFNHDPSREDVIYMPRPAKDGDKIVVNTVGVFSERVPAGTEVELGSDAQENHHQWYADIYAQNEAVGTHVSGDIRDILRGKLPSAGAARPILQVYDFTQPTPPPIFWCEIENVSRERSPVYRHPWQQFWFVVPFTIVDTYDNELDPVPTPYQP